MGSGARGGRDLPPLRWTFPPTPQSQEKGAREGAREVLVLFPVEQALHDAAGTAGDSPVVLPQVAGGRAQAAGEVGELLRLRGQRVAAGALHEEPVVAGPLAEDI